MSHPNILRMYGCIRDSKNIYLLLELGTGCLFRELRHRVHLTNYAGTFQRGWVSLLYQTSHWKSKVSAQRRYYSSRHKTLKYSTLSRCSEIIGFWLVDLLALRQATNILWYIGLCTTRDCRGRFIWLTRRYLEFGCAMLWAEYRQGTVLGTQ
jgi:hypothetical protein